MSSYDPVTWWNAHRNAEGMDTASKRGLLEQLRKEKADLDRIKADLDGAGAGFRDISAETWSANFEERYGAVEKAIAEIEASLT